MKHNLIEELKLYEFEHGIYSVEVQLIPVK